MGFKSRRTWCHCVVLGKHEVLLGELDCCSVCASQGMFVFFCQQVPQLWNKLPEEIRFAESVIAF